jgi:hypothetical protein
MLSDGHFRLHRATFSHPIVGIARPRRFALWQWMIGEAYFTESGDKSLKRGQFAATNRQLAAVVGMPLGTFKAFKAELIEEGMVSVSRPTSARAPSVWTVVNYDEFQAKTPDPSPNPSIAINPTPGIPVVTGVSDGSETSTRPIAQPIDSHPYKENSITKTLETPVVPKGTGNRFEDERGNYWPPVPKKGSPTYSAPFNEIWKLWLLASAAAGTDHKGGKIVKTPDKAKTYELCRMHLVDGTITAADLYRATDNYLAPYRSGREKIACVHPKTFCRRKMPMFLEHVAPEVAQTGATVTLETFGTLRRAFSFARAAALRLGVERPEFNDSDGWEAFTAIDAEIQRVAVQMVGEV